MGAACRLGAGRAASSERGNFTGPSFISCFALALFHLPSLREGLGYGPVQPVALQSRGICGHAGGGTSMSLLLRNCRRCRRRNLCGLAAILVASRAPALAGILGLASVTSAWPGGAAGRAREAQVLAIQVTVPTAGFRLGTRWRPLPGTEVTVVASGKTPF